MRDNWKLIVTFTVAGIVLALVGLRVKHTWNSPAPASLHYEQHSSPGLFFNGDLRRSWKNVGALVARTRQEERAARLPLVDISFLQVCELPNDALRWDTVEMHNPGFEPLHRVERIEPGKSTLIGYYTLDGQPLDYDTKTDLRDRQQTLTTVTMAEPLAAGQSVLFFRVLRSSDRISTNQLGKCVANLGRLPVSPAKLRVAGFAVPAPATVEKSAPAASFVQEADGVHVLTWFSSQLDTSAPDVRVTFTVPK